MIPSAGVGLLLSLLLLLLIVVFALIMPTAVLVRLPFSGRWRRLSAMRVGISTCLVVLLGIAGGHQQVDESTPWPLMQQIRDGRWYALISVWGTYCGIVVWYWLLGKSAGGCSYC